MFGDKFRLHLQRIFLFKHGNQVRHTVHVVQMQRPDHRGQDSGQIGVNHEQIASENAVAHIGILENAAHALDIQNAADNFGHTVRVIRCIYLMHSRV